MLSPLPMLECCESPGAGKGWDLQTAAASARKLIEESRCYRWGVDPASTKYVLDPYRNALLAALHQINGG